MGYYLTVANQPPLPQCGRDATIEARIFANHNRTEQATSAGDPVEGARPRTEAEQRELTHPRRIQGYHKPQYGIYPMGGANDTPNQQEGGSNDIPINPPVQPPIDVQPTPAKCLQQAKDPPMAATFKASNSIS
ncbi:uncharacterized protein ARMOST_10386 [Armillaria ostoyae]|uniref:Uncharacterized protein n=1 Tax=Armillaria ostoyae TaxID=47428 RepID=A0A284RE50_ARMOS|nr:uncharacterized protein ARMOST_10386 [Armillaria ostoyae]